MSWAQNTLDGEKLGTVSGGGYQVERYNAAGDSVGGCSGKVTGSAEPLTCTETSVPGGTWTYKVVPVLSSWSGPASDAQSISVDRTGPAVTLTSPADGSSSAQRRPAFSGAAGDAQGDDTTVHLKVYSGPSATGQPVIDRADINRTGTSWSFTPAADLAGGTYTATVSQSDTFNNATTTAPRTFTITVDTTKPSSSVTFPATTTPPTWLNAAGLRAGCGTADADVCGSASDDVEVTKVEVSIQRSSDNTYWNGSAFGALTEQFHITVGTTNWRYAFTPPASGTYTIKSRATDSAGNVQTSLGSASLHYDVAAPTGTVTAPAANANVRGSAVQITSDSADTGGSGVKHAKFEHRAVGAATWNTIGTDAASPYAAAWDTTGLPVGDYELRVTTEDHAGNTTTSATRTVKVIALGKPSAITLINGNNTSDAGKVANKDSVVITFSEDIAPGSVCSGWDGASLPAAGLTARITAADVLTLEADSTVCSGSINLGSLDLKADYIQGSDATFQGSSGPGRTSIAWSAANDTLTVTLGAKGTGGTLNATAQALHKPVYTPDADITTADGVGINNAAFTAPTASRF